VRSAQLAWQAALSRAQGEKVLDDPKLLRRSIKKDAKQKQRSTKKWQERVGQQQEAKQARQDKCVLGAGFVGGGEGCLFGGRKWGAV